MLLSVMQAIVPQIGYDRLSYNTCRLSFGADIRLGNQTCTLANDQHSLSSLVAQSSSSDSQEDNGTLIQFKSIE